MQNRVMTCKCGHATITPSLCMSGSRTQRQVGVSTQQGSAAMPALCLHSGHALQVHFQPTYSHFTSRILSNSCPLMQQRQQKRTHTSKGQPAQTTAMINVDGSPPLFLGAGMIAAGAVLYQLRNSRPYITKDFDIVLSCIAIFAGGILVFQVH